MSYEDFDIGEDRLDGAEAIAEFLGLSLRRTYYLLERNEIPSGKQGARGWVGSKRRLASYYKDLTGGVPEDRTP